MRRVLFVVISVMLLISTALAYMVSTWTVANSMTVIKRDVNITAYSDEACTKPLTSLSWGEIKQKDRAEKIFWIKNVGKDNGTAAWYSDLEEKTDWNAYEEMYYWNETRGEWVPWRESKLMPIIEPEMPTIKPTAEPIAIKPTPTEEIIIPFAQNVTTKEVTEEEYKVIVWIETGEGPWMEPGDVVKVKYVIKTEASCEPGDYSWTLYLGWE